MSSMSRKPRPTIAFFDPLTSPVKPSPLSGSPSVLEDDKENTPLEGFLGSWSKATSSAGEQDVSSSSRNNTDLLIDFGSPAKPNAAKPSAEQTVSARPLISWGDTPVKRPAGAQSESAGGRGGGLSTPKPDGPSFDDHPATPTSSNRGGNATLFFSPSSSPSSPVGDADSSPSAPPSAGFPTSPSELGHDHRTSLTPTRPPPILSALSPPTQSRTQTPTQTPTREPSSPADSSFTLPTSSHAGFSPLTRSPGAEDDFRFLSASSPSGPSEEDPAADASFRLEDLNSTADRIEAEDDDQLAALHTAPSPLPRRQATSQTPLRVRTLLKASLSQSMSHSFSSPGPGRPESPAGWGSPAGGAGDETFCLDSGGWGEVGDESLLMTGEFGGGVDGTWLDNEEQGVVWRKVRGRSTEPEEVAAKDVEVAGNKVEAESISPPRLPTVMVEPSESVANVLQPSQSSSPSPSPSPDVTFNGMASTFHRPTADDSMLMAQSLSAPAGVDMTMSFSGNKSVFHSLADTSSNLLDESQSPLFVVDQPGDVTFGGRLSRADDVADQTFDPRASTFPSHPHAGDVSSIFDQRPPSSLGDVLADKTFAGGLGFSLGPGAAKGSSAFSGGGTLGRSFFKKLPKEMLLLDEELPELEVGGGAGDETFMDEMASPMKRPGQDDEAAGVFGGKVTEGETVERRARLNRAAERVRRPSPLAAPESLPPSKPAATTFAPPLKPSAAASTSKLPTPPTTLSPLPPIASTPRPSLLARRPSLASGLIATPRPTPRASRPIDPSAAPKLGSMAPPPSTSRSTTFNHRRSLSLAATSARTPARIASSTDAAVPISSTRATPSRGHVRASSTSTHRGLSSRRSSSTLAAESLATLGKGDALRPPGAGASKVLRDEVARGTASGEADRPRGMIRASVSSSALSSAGSASSLRAPLASARLAAPAPTPTSIARPRRLSTATAGTAGQSTLPSRASSNSLRTAAAAPTQISPPSRSIPLPASTAPLAAPSAIPAPRSNGLLRSAATGIPRLPSATASSAAAPAPGGGIPPSRSLADMRARLARMSAKTGSK